MKWVHVHSGVNKMAVERGSRGEVSLRSHKLPRRAAHHHLNEEGRQTCMMGGTPITNSVAGNLRKRQTLPLAQRNKGGGRAGDLCSAPEVRKGLGRV